MTDRCEHCGSTDTLTTFVNALNDERTICANCRTAASAIVVTIPRLLIEQAADLVAERATA